MYLGVVTAESVTSLLGILGSVFTFIVGQFTALVDVVMSNELLLIPVGVILTLTIIKIFKRFF
ncbi:MAG: hypothetical protein PHX62_03675 [Bacilli bacterium]|nr:hypothetical protein [Bacilli bacterium]